jgi:hypothetical protein
MCCVLGVPMTSSSSAVRASSRLTCDSVRVRCLRSDGILASEQAGVGVTKKEYCFPFLAASPRYSAGNASKNKLKPSATAMYISERMVTGGRRREPNPSLGTWMEIDGP